MERVSDMALENNIWQTWQQIQQSVAAIGRTLAGGLVVSPTPVNYTVVSLPATAASGQYAFATNGRKPGEGPGAGTGIPVFFDSATGTWFTYSGVVVTT